MAVSNRRPATTALNPRLLRMLGLLLMALALAACGYHLRGAATEPLGDKLPILRLAGIDDTVGFGKEVARVLRANGVRLKQQLQSEIPVLWVKPVRQSRQVLSVDRNIRAREYVLISAVDYALTPPGVARPAKYRKVSVRRELVVDPRRILGSNQEERRLRREMEQELAQVLVLRLRY